MSRIELMALWIFLVVLAGTFAQMGWLYVSGSFALVAVALFIIAPFLVGEDQ